VTSGPGSIMLRFVARPADEIIQDAFRRAPTVQGAARVLGVSSRTLFRWLHDAPNIAAAYVDRAGPGNARRAQGAAARDAARAVLARGGTYAEAAHAAGVSRATVARWAGEGPRRGRGRPRGGVTVRTE
jgi:transposase-like protein